MVYLSIVFIVSLSAINLVNLFFIYKLEEILYEEKRQAQENQIVFPEIKLKTKEEELDYIYDKYTKFVLMWEAILTTSSIMLFYLILNRHLEKEKKQKEFLEIMILTISHKFGNFLSALKVNLELTKSTKSEKALMNIEKYVSNMNDELKILIDILRKAQNDETEKITIKEVIQQILEKVDIKEKRLLLQLNDKKIIANRNILENVLFILIHNSASYSKTFIHIRMFKDGMIVIRNDIEKRRGGSGIGLTLADKFCSLNNWHLHIRESKNSFTVFFNPF